jgi:MFS family permease
LTALACSTTPVLIGYDLTLIGSIIANQQFIEQFGVYDTASQALSLPADNQLVWSILQYISVMAAAIASGSLNDIFGRRVCFLITVGYVPRIWSTPRTRRANHGCLSSRLTVIGTFVELFSTNWKIWIVAKIFMGSAMGSMQAPCA